MFHGESGANGHRAATRLEGAGVADAPTGWALTAPSTVARAYPRPPATAVVPLRPVPLNGASPKVKIPPSAAASQYPWPVGEAAMPTIGWWSAMAPVEPKNDASPKLKMPPSVATIQ